ncbi:hypothetical protein CDAR_437711 [Caerostris darwini]|uniref:Ribosomal protein S3 n=1 Tax=Caerostris darwini TaxID=1538125 RepID=A0AAV4NWE2_9ARAC|nr:hypothetical protein CDAR_437711 [Caerostris darwini]
MSRARQGKSLNPGYGRRVGRFNIQVWEGRSLRGGFKSSIKETQGAGEISNQLLGRKRIDTSNFGKRVDDYHKPFINFGLVQGRAGEMRGRPLKVYS